MKLPIIKTTLSSAILLLGACSSIPTVPFGYADLNEAQELFAAGEYPAANRALRDREREHFDRHSQNSYSLLAGDIAWELEDWDAAILHYQEFLLFGGAASTSERVEERLFGAGLQLINGERRAFGIFPDRTRGARVLMDLALWAPRSPWAGEALAITANWFFDDRQFNQAADAYRVILQEHPGSEFTDLATYRLGMCAYERITGPWLEEKLIEEARSQIEHYLLPYPTGLFKDEAVLVSAELEEISAERELKIGDYYLTIGNFRGARAHYLEASTRAGTKVSNLARQKLESLPDEDLE